jgi:hypothetical protein
MEGRVNVSKRNMSATDHLPIMAEIMILRRNETIQKAKPNLMVKRSMENLTEC